MVAQIEIRPWAGNKSAKRKRDLRFDAELPPLSGVLRACPFCGGDPKLEHTWTASYWIECEDCGAEASGKWAGDASKAKDHKKAAQSAIAAWNRRT